MSYPVTWKEAICSVLETVDGPLHYIRIAEEIGQRKLRSDLRETPHMTVASTITQSLQKEGNKSPFMALGHGLYALRAKRSHGEGLSH